MSETLLFPPDTTTAEAADPAEALTPEAEPADSSPAWSIAPGDLEFSAGAVSLRLRVPHAMLSAIQEAAAARSPQAARRAVEAALADASTDSPLARWQRLLADMGEADKRIGLADAQRQELQGRRKRLEIEAPARVAEALVNLDAEMAAALAERQQARKERAVLAGLVSTATTAVTEHARKVAYTAWAAEAASARSEWESLAGRAVEALSPLLADLLAAQLTTFRYGRHPSGAGVADEVLAAFRREALPPADPDED